jgi:hypothetical protein
MLDQQTRGSHPHQCSGVFNTMRCWGSPYLIREQKPPPLFDHLCYDRVQHRTPFGGTAAPEAISKESHQQKERYIMRFHARFVLVLALVATVWPPPPVP